MRTRLAVAMVLVVLPACKSDEEKLMGDWEDIASTLEATQADCDKMADAVEAYDKKNGDSFRALQQRWHEAHPGNSDSPDPKVNKRMQTAAGRIVAATVRCASNKRLAADMKALKGTP